MRCSIDSFRISLCRAVAAAGAVGCAALVIAGIATAAEPEAAAVAARGLEQTADDAIAKLVAFLEHPEAGPEAGAEAGAEGGDEAGARSPNPAPQPNQGEQAGPPGGWEGPLAAGQGGAIVLPPKVEVFSFDVEVGADGKLKQGAGGPAGFTLESIEGLEGIIARHVQSMQGPQPPMGPLQHSGEPHQSGPQRGGPGPQFQGRMVPPGHQAPPPGMLQDDLNRRFEEHARDLHRHVEEMARGLGENLKGAAGGGEELRQMHQKLAKTHEQLQDRFQDIRRRFAEQQERIERLEQEVRRLHEAHGAGHAEGEKRERKREEKGAKRRDEEKQGAVPGANATPHVSYEGEESESL